MATAPALRSDPLGRLLSAEVYAAVNAVDALALLHVDETYDDDGTRHVRLAEHAVEALECALDEHVPAHARMLTPLVLVSALALAEPPLDGLGAYVAARRALLGPHLEPCPAEAWRALELMHLTPYTRRALVGRTYRRLGLVIQGRRMSDDVVSQLVGALNTGTGGGLVLQRFKITAN